MLAVAALYVVAAACIRATRPVRRARALVLLHGRYEEVEVAARRCSPCGVSWPADSKHMECPGCGAKTDYLSNGTPSDPQTLFNAFYLERGERDVDIDWDREYPGMAEIHELESIPTLDSHPTEGAA